MSYLNELYIQKCKKEKTKIITSRSSVSPRLVGERTKEVLYSRGSKVKVRSSATTSSLAAESRRLLPAASLTAGIVAAVEEWEQLRISPRAFPLHTLRSVFTLQLALWPLFYACYINKIVHV